jgi:hypothetical protein
VFCIVALASGPIEGLMASLLEDDRILLRLPSLEFMIDEEMRILGELPGLVWSSLAGLCRCEAGPLRSNVIGAAMTSVAFFTWRVLSETTELPWRLAVGNKIQNLEELRGQAEPSEPLAKKIWCLLQVRFPVEQLEEGLCYIARAPWSSLVVEQGHAGASIIMKHHAELGEKSMMERAFLHAVRPMFLEPQEVREQRQLWKRIEKLQGKRPSRITGRHVFCKAAMDVATSTSCSDKSGLWLLRKQVMANHAQEYEALDADTKRYYERQAQKLKDERSDEILDDISMLKSLDSLREMRDAFRASERQPYRIDSCRIDARGQERVQAMCAELRFSIKAVEGLRQASMSAPAPPSVGFKLEVSAVPAYVKPAAAHHSWVNEVCRQREHFHQCGIVIHRGPLEEDEHFAFSFALQNPIVLGLTVLKRRPRELRRPAGDVDDAYAASWAFDFDLLVRQCKFSTRDLEGIAEDRVRVLKPIVFLSDGRVVSDAVARPLRDVLKELPLAPRGTSSAADGIRQANPARSQAELVAEHPWLIHHVPELRRFARRKAAEHGGPDEVGSECNSGDEEMHDESADVAADIFARLAELRADLAKAEAADIFFRVVPLGGMSTLRTRGVGIDAYRGKAVGRDAESWCRRYGLQLAARYDISLYGPDGAATMAKEWCCRMTFFFTMFLDAGCPAPGSFPYVADCGYKESELFRGYAASLELPLALRRLEQLRCMMPVGS